MFSAKVQNKINKDQPSLVKTFLKNESILKKFLRRFTSCSHEINDITQETILRALQVEKNRTIEEPKAFLFGIAKNVVRKNLDKKSRSLIDFIEGFSLEKYVYNEPTIDDCIDSKKRMYIFWEAVSTLPLQCQRVFVLKKVHGYSHQAIANELDISISTTEKHVAAGLLRCNDYMEAYLNNDAQNELKFMKVSSNSSY
ncbi:RNA polymerase sigma factor [Colwellia sp. 1_MG-2023]|uniref:RNA polymerase sigma factor n=1 Tax=Colwellia sp. 1_MG-2023 TaxID=3062649 RepID=UPI0026E3CD89|nr:RNA polymerase sigma factor [Colwellia sp. 1_MG-2023]MDO6446969.1 RNA polymerase sigma factor [Colwellia sp. 1_MG-2023]